MNTKEREDLVRASSSNRRWDRQTAEMVIAELDASGESLPKFARRHDLSSERLRRWRKVLSGEGSAESSPVRFHPIVVSEGNRIGWAESRLELLLANGRRIRVHEGFDSSTLLELVRVLESGVC